MKYPKIETLFKRDEKTHKVIKGKFKLEHFYLPKKWLTTEKLDGTNVRIEFSRRQDGHYHIVYGGRTDNAQIPTFLLEKLQDLFGGNKLNECFGDLEIENKFTLFGEGYGSKIQKAGEGYGDVNFALFDVIFERYGFSPKWLEWYSILDIAEKLKINIVPVLVFDEMEQIVEEVRQGLPSQRGQIPMEGVVARTDPLLFNANGDKIIWKLKTKDFAK